MAKAQKSALKTYYGIEENDPAMTLDLLGGKGYHLASRIAKLGLPVPPARVITTAVCKTYQKAPKETMAEIAANAVPNIMAELAKKAGYAPLVSVRSGAKISMPGMMDTILNVGLTKDTLPFWERRLGDRAALDSRRRLLQMYGSVVFGIEDNAFADALDKEKKKRRAKTDQDLDATSLRSVCEAYEKIIQKAGFKMPETAEGQVAGAIEAVFKSWGNERAVYYRKINGISEDLGTAAVIQQMVFGNLNDDSCTGVVFTRNPSTGRQQLMGEFLENAQGEDVVAGVRTPYPIDELEEWNPRIWNELKAAAKALENDGGDMQDIEFTVEDGQLFLLQTRAGKRSALAAAKIAIDFVGSGKIDKREAFSRLTLSQYNALSAPMIMPGYNKAPDAQGLSASTGIATARAVFSSEAAVGSSEPCILIAEETTPEDLPGIHASVGILTATGGVTSHAAVVARGMDKVCVVGASSIKIVKDKNGEPVGAMFGSLRVEEGDILTLDGAGGRAWVGSDVPVVHGASLPEVEKLNEWLYDVFPVYKLVTKVDDLDCECASVFATYELDREEPSFIRSEITESLEYLNGVIDLSTLGELVDEVDQRILALGGSGLDDQAFEAKWKGLLDFHGERSSIKVFLGKRHDDWAEKARDAGFTVLEPVKKLAKDNSSHAAFFSISENEQDRDKAFALAKTFNAPKGSIAATGGAPYELLDALASAKAQQQDVQPFLALSAPQLMKSALR